MIPVPLRILVVLPLYGGSLPVGRYCVSALRDLGHTVEVFEAPAFLGAFSALKELHVSMDKHEGLETSLLQVVSQAIHAKAEALQPDLVIALAQAPVTRQLLKRLQRDGIPSAMWFVEDFRLFPYWRAFAPLYDFFFVIQKEPFLSELRTVGVEGVYLPLAALPAFHRPLTLSALEQDRFGSAVSFMGAGYPNRRTAFQALRVPDFKVWGSDWEEAALQGVLQDNGARVAPEDAVKIFNASAVNLNLHSSIHAEPVQHGDFVNPRTFELAACGAFQLVDARDLLPELFVWFVAHPEERAAVAKRAQLRVCAEHTYHKRMETLLQTVRTRRPDWLARFASATSVPLELTQDLPEGLTGVAEEAAWTELLARMHLPETTAFADVVFRLRQQPGTRTPFEASILFLDEWRKQYGK
ncbi:MAG: glycosyltransferase [Bilophila sp.]